ncbi:UNVERIFIED_ORG: hypothetical protein FNL38_11115 [Nocardia globerula]|uniref:Nucleotidyltransferase AbiEii toxin of type IV toxin-antitoxin system n=1 Tax=Nocardia globerula TaxID=1818 RepID=A0A652YHT2_NOCGL
MKRSDLEKAVVAACGWVEESQVVIFGSQSVLGSYDEASLPEEAIRSMEVDMTPASAFTTGADVTEKVSTLNVWVGEDSPFHLRHGVYVEGIHRDTVVLPLGWENRLVAFTASGTGDDQNYGRTGLCLHPIDLCVSKLIAGREKDHEFVGALIRDNIIDPAEVLDRIDKAGIDWSSGYPDNRDLAVSRARSWLQSKQAPAAEDYSDIARALSTVSRSHPRTIREHLRTNTSGAQDKSETAHDVGPDLSTERGYDLTD